MRGNTIILQYEQGRWNQTEQLFQYDYGQKLILEGIDLPTTYEVHFANVIHGNSKTSIGDGTGVEIPDEFLQTGQNVYFWLYLHTGENDGETELVGMIPVAKRAKPTNDVPTPVQQDEIEQTLAALNAAVAMAEAARRAIEAAIPAGGTQSQVLAKKSDADRDTEWVDPTGGGGGTSNYEQLENLPQIGGVALIGNKSLHELGVAAEEDVPDITDLESDVRELKTEINSRPDVEESTETGVDLDFSDENGNIVARFSNGNIRTAKFNSDNGIYEKTFSYTDVAGTETITHLFPKGTRLAFHLTNNANRNKDTIASKNVTYKYTDRSGTVHTICVDYGYNFPEYTLPEDAISVSVTFPTNLNWGENATLSFKVYSMASFHREPVVLTVGVGKQYTSLRAALEYALQYADAMNRYEIHVYPGTYDTLSYFTTEEIETEGFEGLFVTNGISLIGMGQRSEIILTAEMSTSDYTTAKRNDVSTLNILGNVTVKNMTIKAKNIRYAVHDDTALMGHQDNIHVFEEVTFYGENLTSGGGGQISYGAGGGNCKRMYFKNCDFSDAMTIHTSENMVHEYTVYIDGCRSRLMIFTDYNSGLPAHFYLNNCNVARIKFNQSGSSHDQYIQLEGDGVNKAMITCPSGYVYALDGVHKYYGSNVTAGKAVKLNTTMDQVVVADSLDSVFGISIGVANGATYVQTEGWINSNTLGLSSLSVGDYLTVNTGTGAVEVGTSSNAVAQVRYVDSDGIAYAKLML